MEYEFVFILLIMIISLNESLEETFKSCSNALIAIAFFFVYVLISYYYKALRISALKAPREKNCVFKKLFTYMTSLVYS